MLLNLNNNILSADSHIIGESLSGSSSVMSRSPSTGGGGGGGRDEWSEVRLRRSGGNGRTRAGWR